MFTDKTLKAITTAIQEIIEIELSLRDVIESHLKEKKISYTLETINSKQAIDCMLCPSKNYMSFMECKNCKKRACISHINFCECLNNSNNFKDENNNNIKNFSLSLYYRFNSDLKYYSRSKANGK